MALIVNDTTPRAQYTASGGQTVFEYAFEIFVDADLLVYLTPVGQTADDAADLLTLTTDYAVSNAGVTGGGDVTLVVAATAGDIITIVRDVAVARLTDYQTAGDFLATTVNDDFDKIVMMVGQLEDILASRGLSFQDTLNLTGVDTTMPAPVADGLLKWNAAANALQAVDLSTLDASLVVVSAFVETLLDDATADDFIVTLGITSTIAELNLLDGATLKHKVIEIGDWNMDSTVSKSVAIGLAPSVIRSISVVIRDDDDLEVRDFLGTSTTDASNTWLYCTGASIEMGRATSGAFDSTNYDATSYNRGWITIWYV